MTHANPSFTEQSKFTEKRILRTAAKLHYTAWNPWMIARRLGSAAKFRHEVMASIEQITEGIEADDAADDIELEAVRRSPEFQRVAARFKAEHWTTWLDQSIPALEGLTPREAVKTEDGLELLEALLADYDFKNREMPDNPMQPDTAALRRELGLGVER